MNSYRGLLTFAVVLAILLVPQMMGHEFYMSQFLGIPRLWTILLYSHVITVTTINVFTIENGWTLNEKSETLPSFDTKRQTNGTHLRAPVVDSCITHLNEIETVI